MMMLVDCQTCPVRDVHCADCVVTALAATVPMSGAPTGSTIGTSPDSLPLDRAERRAVSVLLAAGLVSHDTAHAARAVRDAPARQRVSSPRRAAV